MEECFCEVIGCMRRACWKLRDPEKYTGEDYLCHVHWEHSSLQRCLRATAYVHLSTLFSEGTSQEACVQFALIERSSAGSGREKAHSRG